MPKNGGLLVNSPNVYICLAILELLHVQCTLSELGHAASIGVFLFVCRYKLLSRFPWIFSLIFANCTCASVINSNQVQFILVEQLEEAWVLPVYCLWAVWEEGQAVDHLSPSSRCREGACVRCTLAYLHSGPRTWPFTKPWLLVHLFSPRQQVLLSVPSICV